ncbi:MAG TPA: IPT/TIG domain-containing protein [Gemmatimonadales bacterium]|nr:IPT/TIG domain-containing protein [Gemmatimonadales bacterium]
MSGSPQDGAPGVPLAEPLVVQVSDGDGSPLGGVNVTWATPHGGTFSSATTKTGADGRASVTWTPGATPGSQTATASLSGATGSPVSFTATITAADAPVVTGVSPSPLVEGQAATLTGTGFTATTTVTVDGVPATVTSASATTLAITVPVVCKPARTGAVRAANGLSQSAAFSAPVAPAATLALDVGKQVVLTDPATHCIQFGASAASEDYLIGVQSTSELVSSVTPITVTGSASGAAVTPLPALSRGRLAGYATRTTLVDGDRARRWTERARSEMRIRDAERRLFDGNGYAAFPLVARAAGGTAFRYERGGYTVAPGVGDVVALTLPNYASGNGCNAIAVTAQVKVVGAKGIWLVDQSNPPGYTTSDIQGLSDQLDGYIYNTSVGEFGAPTDLDGNGKILVLLTKEVNKQGGVLGFVSTTDLVAKSACASSNEGEIFYGAVPDLTGQYALGKYTLEKAKADAPFLIAHEFTHIIQFSRRLYPGWPTPGAQRPVMARWTGEGQATLAEEVVGFAVEGHATRTNLGFQPAFNADDPASIDWYSDRFGDLAMYFGFKDGTSKFPGAPGECSWLDEAPATSPCQGGRDVYGVPWSFLRWLTDQYGPDFPGGEAGLQQKLIDSDGVGYANISNVVGVPIRTLLARWAAALYVDDRVPGADASLTMATWNLYDIFDGNLVESARLVPTSRGFGDFTETGKVRGGSTAYFRVSGTNRPATAVKVRGNADAPLPAVMQVFVVRLR